MSQYWMLAAIGLPILGAVAIPLLPFPNRKTMLWYIETLVLMTSALVALVLMGGKTEAFHVVHFVNNLSISFKIDGMGMVFAGLGVFTLLRQTKRNVSQAKITVLQ